METTAASEPTPASAADHEGRWARWRAGSFGPASELPYRRRTSDRIRLVVAAIVLAACIEHWSDPSAFERDLFQLFNGLPDDLTRLFRDLYQLGALWAVGIVAGAALVGRRWRLARDLAIAGALAAVLGRLIGALVVDGASLQQSFDAVTRLDQSTPPFPLVRLAVIVAVLCAASPYLTRPVRRIGQLFVLLVAIAAMYLGIGVPDGILAALVLGWGIAAAVHLVFGSPGGRPTRAQVRAALAELGVEVATVDLPDVQPAHGSVMTASDATGPLEMRVLGRDEADAQLLARFWRLLLYKEGTTELHLTRLQDIEHQGYALLLAERAGVRVPEIVVVGTAGPRTAVGVVRPLPGPTLADLAPETIHDDLLVDLWRQVGSMHAAGVAHRELNLRHVTVTDQGPGVRGFESSATTATPLECSRDVAELLASSAAVVGDERAIAAARRGIGDEALTEALPVMQPAALSGETRHGKRSARKELAHRLGDLRTATATAIGIDAPALQELYRVNSTNLLMAIGTLIAVFALMSQIGDPQEFWDTIKNADWFLLGVALIVSLLTNFATAVALMGTVPMPLPLLRTAELQLSMSFSNLAVPAIGGMAAQIAFLQKQGIDLASAVASGGFLTNAGNIVQSIFLLFVAIWLSPDTLRFGDIPTSSIAAALLLILVLGLVVGAVIWGVPKLRKLVVPPLVSAMTTMRDALRSPKRVALLLGGNMVNSLMYATVLLICINAFGGHANFWSVLAINIFTGTIASLVPIPGGGTAVSAVGLTGGLTAIGVSTEVAVAAVLADQLVASFIPAVPGFWATHDLLDNGYI